MRTIVISQPMYFPWVGLFEQARLADVFVHFDDVQLPQGRSFTNRVQIKTRAGSQWLTVPLRRGRGKQLIQDVVVADDLGWRDQHLRVLKEAYAGAPHREEMLALVAATLATPSDRLADIATAGFDAILRYFALKPELVQDRSSHHAFATRSSRHLLDLVRVHGGDRYVTGHGALDYIDYDLFEACGVAIAYMDYRKIPYPQLHGAFTPYLSILDLVANAGTAGAEVIVSPAVYWREFAHEPG